MRCPKSKFPIGIIVFDEHESIVHAIQGLSLSTTRINTEDFDDVRGLNVRVMPVAPVIVVKDFVLTTNLYCFI